MKTIFKNVLSGLSASVLMAGVAVAAPLANNSDAPDFKLPDTEGETVTLSDYKDKVVVLEWVNFTCPFVQKHYSKGHMQKLQDAYDDKGVEWFLINSGPEDAKKGSYNAAKFEELADEHSVEAEEILLDRDGKVGKAYGAMTTPHMVVINKGKVVYQGAIDDKKSTSADDIATSVNYVVKALDAVLEGKEVATPVTKGYGCGVKY
ncbi:MAG: redoxin domain-containing protein [Akkermansiaceae bacterium]